ncbi:MAG TPA: formate dehydrogenase subunit delta [Beijerinckiaceae bacterium]|nr:formate dehydrogenase subunit delta [Beijerinckiaceae bacterium]
MSNPDKLIHMANQIADFFRPYPHAEAVAGVHDHIRAFWTPPMRADLLAHCEAGDPKVDVLVSKAMLDMPTAVSPADKEAAGPAEVGEIGSVDAG